MWNKDINTAPKDRPVLFAGRWKPYDILPGGTWHMEIFHWTTYDSFISENTKYFWASNFRSLEDWHIDWTHWAELPEPPKDGEND